MTLLKKIISHKLGQHIRTGQFIEIEVDLAMANDITAPIAIKALEKIGWEKLYDKNRIFLVMSHYTPAKDIASANQVKITRDFAIKHGIENFFDEAQGIEHSLLPELGYIKPGMVIVGADSHSCTYGAFGAFSTGVGSTDMAYIWATGKFWMKVPEELKFVIHGKPNKWVTAKDVILRIIKEISCEGARYMNM
ncbi:MAG: aconitase family protein, partial [bacterium]|nr:aconitase family protein [bacterium]